MKFPKTLWFGRVYIINWVSVLPAEAIFHLICVHTHSQILSMLEANYPEMIHRAFLINCKFVGIWTSGSAIVHTAHKTGLYFSHVYMSHSALHFPVVI